MKTKILPFMVIAIFISSCASKSLRNADFKNGLDGWKKYDKGVIIDSSDINENAAARIFVQEDIEPDWYNLEQQITAEPGAVYEAKTEVLCKGVRNGYGATVSMLFFDKTKQRIGESSTRVPVGIETKMVLTVRGRAPQNAAKVSVTLSLHGNGQAYFDNVSLIKKQRPEGNKKVVISVTDEIVCDSFIGYGAEDDGWFFNENNAGHGVDEADIALREKRIEWMDPDYIRMFFWYKEFNPSGDWQTFDWDNDGMNSHYRTLDTYQRIGARVCITGVEWAIEKPWVDSAALAKATGALLEHLIITKGYTCIKDWILTNEPGGAFIITGGDFPKYVEIHRLMKQELNRRGLKINIIGSDDAAGIGWFSGCVNDSAYFETVDIFASHHYAKVHELDLIPDFFEDRTKLLDAKKPSKPLMMTEFGFMDERTKPPNINPLMQEYPYALYTQLFSIDGLNSGIAGFNFWCLHEVYYATDKVNRMHFGLWNYKDRNWSVRPVYHCVANFCRLTEPGDVVVKCKSTCPEYVKAALVGDTLFWVNMNSKAVEVRIAGRKVEKLCIMTEKSLHGDRECGQFLERPKYNKFNAPLMSFGYAIVK